MTTCPEQCTGSLSQCLDVDGVTFLVRATHSLLVLAPVHLLVRVWDFVQVCAIALVAVVVREAEPVRRVTLVVAVGKEAAHSRVLLVVQFGAAV